MEASGRSWRQPIGRVAGLAAAFIILLGCLNQGVGLAQGSPATQDSANQGRDLVKMRIYTDMPQAQAGVFDLKKKVAVIEPPQGHVEILTKESVLTAKKVIYNQSDDTAELSGDVTVTQKDVHAKAANMRADFGQEAYILEGDVYLKQQEVQEDGATETKLEVWSQWMQVGEGAKHVLARGEVHLIEPEREAWADELDYDDVKEIVTLTGDVRIETNDGNVLTGAKVVIDLSSDEAVMYGPTYAEFILESDSDTIQDAD